MLAISQLQFSYPGGFELRIPKLELAAGATLALTGPSGSGKTTLLNLIAGILKPDAGCIRIDDTDLASLRNPELRELRITRLGLVFQEFELLEYLTVLDNILLPARITPALDVHSALRARATELAAQAGIEDKLLCRPNELSQGERQRVALCRALIAEPDLILADEPTGNLDPDNKSRALDHLLDYVRSHNAALITATHDHQLVERFQRHMDFSELTRTAGA